MVGIIHSVRKGVKGVDNRRETPIMRAMKINNAACLAIEKAGGNAGLQRLLRPDLTGREALRLQWAVARWKREGVPAQWVAEVSNVTGISKHLLAPRIFPNEAA